MKKTKIHFLIIAVLFAAFSFTSCKSKTKETTAAPSTSVENTNTPASPPVVISGDDELRKATMDATKDYPGVNADVTDSVINLTGEIKRADWQKLNPTLNTLHPKRVNSANLTIK